MEFEKVIKRINERLAVYERKGLTDSANYQRIIERIQLYDLPTTESKNGQLRLSRKKDDIQEINLNDLVKIDNLPSLKQEVAITKKKLTERLERKPTREEIERDVKNYGRLEQWAKDNLPELYIESKSGNEKAQELESMFDSGLRNFDYDYIFQKIQEYELSKNQIFKDLKNESSTFFNEDMFNNEDDFTGI